MRAYTVYLIRSGTARENELGRYIGHTDVSLSDESRYELAEKAADKVFPYVDAVFSSPLKRCLETADIYYPGQNPVVIDDFIECNFGEFENKNAEDLKDSDEFVKWLTGDPDVAPPYGESNRHFFTRVCSAFEKTVDGVLKTGTMNTAIVTHGGVIMAILAAFGLPELPMHDWTCPAGGGFAVRIDPRMWMAGKKVEVFSEFPYEREETVYDD